MGIQNFNSVFFNLRRLNGLGAWKINKYNINLRTFTGFRPVQLEFAKTEFRFGFPMVENSNMPSFRSKNTKYVFLYSGPNWMSLCDSER